MSSAPTHQRSKEAELLGKKINDRLAARELHQTFFEIGNQWVMQNMREKAVHTVAVTAAMFDDKSSDAAAQTANTLGMRVMPLDDDDGDGEGEK